MNWETREVSLILSNTEGMYLDLTNGVLARDIVEGLPERFDHIDASKVDWSYLNNEHKVLLDNNKRSE